MWNLPATIPLIALLLSGILTLSVVRYSVLPRYGKVLLILLLLVSFWPFASFMFHTVRFPSPLFWGYLVIGTGFATTVVGLHFVTEFPRRRRGAVWIKSAYYLSAAVMYVLLITGNIVASADLLPGGLIAISFTTGAAIGWSWATICLLQSIVLLITGMRGNYTAEEKQRIKYPLIGFIFLLFGFLSNIVISAYPVDVAIGIIFIGLIAYATVKGYILKPLKEAPRFLHLAVSLWLGLLLYAVLLVIFHNWLGTEMPAAYLGSGIIVGMIALFLVKHKTSQIPVWLKRRLFPGLSGYWEALEKIKTIDTTRMEWRDALKRLLYLQLQATHADTAIFTALTEDANCFKPVVSIGTGHTFPSSCKIPLRSPIVLFLKEHAGVLSAQSAMEDKRFETLSESERKLLFDSGLELFRGIFTSDGLIGIVGFGCRRGECFSDPEIDFFAAATRSSTPAIVDMLRRRAEEDLRREKNRAESYFNMAGTMLIVLNAEGTIVHINQKGCDLLGFEENELLGKNWFESFTLGDTTYNKTGYIREVKEGHIARNHHENSVITRTGKKRIISWHNTAIKDENGKTIGSLSSGEDITELKQLAESLSESEGKLRLILERIPLGIMVTDLKGTVTQVNHATLTLHGFQSEEEIIGQNILATVAGDDRQRAMTNAEKKLESLASEDKEFNLMRKDGTSFPAKVETALIKDVSGNPVGYVSVAEDLTERLKAEEAKRKVVQYKELDKMKTGLFSVISHELRTPLANIKGYATLLLAYDEKLDGQQKAESLEAIDRSADRLTDLIDHLLDISRLDAGLLRMNIAPASMSNIIKDAVYEAGLRAPKYTFDTKIEDIPDEMRMDSRRIRQVVDNIIDNAIKYSDEGTRITVSTCRKNGELHVSISDQGRGIPSDELENIFDRMYRLEQRLAKDPGGLGLGLNLCKALVEAHRGRIWAESEAGKGSTFWLTLPIDWQP